MKDPALENPFRPSAGATPPEIMGRAGLLDEFDYGLGLGSGAPGLLTIITGARGMGKTVMLSAAHDLARDHGWAVISETATIGFMGRIGEAMRRLAEELGDGPRIRGISGTGVGTSVAAQLTPEQQVAWRTTGENLLRLLATRGAGLVITVDEIHAAERDALADLAATVQHFIRDRLPIGLVLAGLPGSPSVLLDEGPVTFLRRADRIDLRVIPVVDVEASFAAVFAAPGVDAPPAAIRRAAHATGGYPFLVQLVGYFLWQEAEKGDGLSTDVVDKAIARAHRWNAETVIEAELSAVSTRDIEFLRAMAQDDGPSAIGDIGRRLGATSNEVADCRARLIAAGLIEPAGQGTVDFAIPGFRRHLRGTAQK